MEKPPGREALRHGRHPTKPDHPADMIKAFGVAQGGADGGGFQGIPGAVPHDFQAQDNDRPGWAGTIRKECLKSVLGLYS